MGGGDRGTGREARSRGLECAQPPPPKCQQPLGAVGTLLYRLSCLGLGSSGWKGSHYNSVHSPVEKPILPMRMTDKAGGGRKVSMPTGPGACGFTSAENVGYRAQGSRGQRVRQPPAA